MKINRKTTERMEIQKDYESVLKRLIEAYVEYGGVLISAITSETMPLTDQEILCWYAKEERALKKN